MNRNAQKITIAVLLTAVGVLAAVFPVRLGFLGAVLGGVGILYAAVLWTLYRTSFRTRQTMLLVLAAVVCGAVGVLLILNRWWGFVQPKYLLLSELAALGLVTVGFGMQCRDRGLRLWIYVVIGGVGAIVAGLCALLLDRLVVTVGCLTAAVILVLPIVRAAVQKKRADREKNKNIVTVRDRDIEVIPAEDDERGKEDEKQ